MRIEPWRKHTPYMWKCLSVVVVEEEEERGKMRIGRIKERQGKGGRKGRGTDKEPSSRISRDTSYSVLFNTVFIPAYLEFYKTTDGIVKKKDMEKTKEKERTLPPQASVRYSSTNTTHHSFA